MDALSENFSSRRAGEDGYSGFGEFYATEMIAGALAYSKYPKPLKWVMQQIAKKAGEDTDTSQDYEYTTSGRLSGMPSA